jgi:clan AA aspartic protease
MRLVYTEIELSNPKDSPLKPISLKSLVDTGAMTLCIPEHIAVQLKLKEIEKREVTIEDEKSHIVPYIGLVAIKFQGRTCFAGAFVIGNSILTGTVPMEDMDLVISPSGESITVNPMSPNIPSAVVK